MNEGSQAQVLGQCHCGYIHYEAQPPIIKSSYCDCPGCRRATGTLQAPFVTVYRDNIKFTTGEPASFQASSGDRCDEFGAWYYCPHCGGPLFWQSHQGDELDLFAGTLEDTSLFQPTKQTS